MTKAPDGKVELWCSNEVQGSVKTMVKWCIDNILKDIEDGHTWNIRRISYNKVVYKAWLNSLVGAKKVS